MSYTVDGDIEWMAKNAAKEVAAVYARIAAITTNVRVAGNVATARNMPALAIDALADKSVAGDVVEYHLRYEFACEDIAAGDRTGGDLSGERLDALVGAVRDMLNTDFVAALNATNYAVVFHDVREGNMLDESDPKVRRKIIQADAWCYPGAVAS